MKTKVIVVTCRLRAMMFIGSQKRTEQKRVPANDGDDVITRPCGHKVATRGKQAKCCVTCGE